MSWFNFQTMNDVDQGRAVLTYFNNGMVAKYSPDWSYTVDQLSSTVSADPSSFVSELGFVIHAAEMDDSKWQAAMDDLVTKSGGRVPKMTAFFNELQQTATTLDFFDYVKAAPTVAVETAGDIVTGVQKIGDAVIQTGSILTSIAPLAIVAAVLFIGFSRTKQLAG